MAAALTVQSAMHTPVRAPRRADARTYRRRRALVGGVAAVVLAVGVVGAYDALTAGVPAGAATSVSARSGPTSVVAQPGDTLWAIAAHHRGALPIDDYVDALVDLNGGAGIQAGQTVRLP